MGFENDGIKATKPSGRWDGESRQTGISGKLGNGGGARGQQRKTGYVV